MKIIQIMPEFGLAGAEVMCENLTYELKKLGHQVIIISLYDYHSAITERMEQEGVDIRYLDKKKGMDLSLIPRISHIIRTERPDVVHTHRYVMQYTVPACVLAGHKQMVHTVHNVAQKEQTQFGIKLNNMFYRYNHVVPVALSKEVQDTIREVYSIPAEKAPIVFNGIDLSKCIKKTSVAAGERFTVLHIGRFSEQKNHRLMIETMATLSHEYPNIYFQFIGGGELENEIKEMIKDLGLCERIECLGRQGNVYQFLNQADAFMLPSKYEGVPISLIEAMGTGLPIIASRVGGVSDMLVDEESALLIEPNQVALKSAIIRLSHDSVLRNKLANMAVQQAQVFSSQMMARKYVEVYLRTW